MANHAAFAPFNARYKDRATDSVFVCVYLGLSHLLNHGLAVRVALTEHLEPQRAVTALHHVAGLQLEHGVL